MTIKFKDIGVLHYSDGRKALIVAEICSGCGAEDHIIGTDIRELPESHTSPAPRG